MSRKLIPFLRGADRQALITRKIGQHFLGTSLAAAISLGYEKTQRKNEKLLLSALTNPAHFAPWLQRHRTPPKSPLAGIYTVAQLGGQLLKKLGQNPAGRCLLLTLQDQSIRESYLVGGHDPFLAHGAADRQQHCRHRPQPSPPRRQAAPVPDRPAPDRPRRMSCRYSSSPIR
jgi:hypothetical protein